MKIFEFMNRKDLPLTISQLLQKNQAVIACVWAREVHELSGSRYQDYPLSELKDFAEEVLCVINSNLETGSDKCVRKYIERVIGARLQARFQIYEIN